jgi:protein-tyrosine phosphatase
MREVRHGMLWIGNALDARDAARLLAAGIEVVIDLAMEEPPCFLPRAMIYGRFPLVDGAGNSAAVLQAAIDTAVTFVRTNTPTLIACGGGMSRAPAIAAAALAIVEEINPDEILRQIAATGPHDVSPLLWVEMAAVVARA